MSAVYVMFTGRCLVGAGEEREGVDRQPVTKGGRFAGDIRRGRAILEIEASPRDKSITNEREWK